MRVVRASPALVLLFAAACSSAYGPLMAPGQDCLRCHDGQTARRWTAAGTFKPGANVTVTDAAGKTVALRGNEVGNFYTGEALVFPLALAVDGQRMPMPATYGGCNSCHGPGGVASGSGPGGLATGPLMAANQDCLPCHDGAQAKKWTAAGTWPTPNSTVTLRDAGGQTVTLTTNQVGNFYTDAALTFPLDATIDGTTMPIKVTYGGCNQCHANGANGAGGTTGGGTATGPLMAPNQDCLTCHDGAQARRWTAAGTWPKAGSTVTLTDAGGQKVTLTTNAAGNFYTDAALAFPLTANVDGLTMPAQVTYGGCNQCHANGANGAGGAATGANGPLMLPGQDCLTCHDGTQALKWTAAGTWGAAAGQTITLTDARGHVVSLTTNQVGNFYTSQAMTFPLTARAGANTMPQPVTYGGCNRCHGPGGIAR